MYSPTERLLTVLELLQSHKQMSGSELAARLEVDLRTVRRYITMLQDMGIPVETERGPYGGYQLRRGHKLPPLMFSDAEAIALTLGLLVMRAYRFPVGAVAVEGALAKTERVMPENLLYQARALQETITFYVSPPPAQPVNEVVAVLSIASQEHRSVLMRYRSWQGDETQREFDPYGIVFNDGYWHTAGYCHLRRDLRTFRLDRILSLEPSEHTFKRPADFDVLAHVLRSITTIEGADQVEVLLETTMERAKQVVPPYMGTLEQSERGVIFRRAAYQLEWIAHFLLNVDIPLQVIQPVKLREILQQIAVRARQIAGDEAE